MRDIETKSLEWLALAAASSYGDKLSAILAELRRRDEAVATLIKAVREDIDIHATVCDKPASECSTCRVLSALAAFQEPAHDRT